jgi:hypothetical protein
MDLMVVLFCIVAIAFLGGAVCFVRNNPPKSSSRLISAAIAITALALLVIFNIPWAEIAFNRFSSEEKDILARKHFDPAYGFARRSIENCRYFKNYIGELSSLDISWRGSFVRQAGDRTHGFFDFDYVGSDNAGRLTVGFLFKEHTQDGSTPSYELVAPYADETPREIRVLVYASGTSQHYAVNCPWFNQGK